MRRNSRRGAPAPLRRLRRIRSCGRVPLTSVARLTRASSGLFRRRASRRRFASRQLTRAPPLRVLSLRPKRHSLPRRRLSSPVQARAHGRASLPRSPSPRRLCGPSAPRGPGAPSACGPHVRRGRVPLTSVARLIRPHCPCFSPAPPPGLWAHVLATNRARFRLAYGQTRKHRPGVGRRCALGPPG